MKFLVVEKLDLTGRSLLNTDGVRHYNISFLRPVKVQLLVEMYIPHNVRWNASVYPWGFDLLKFIEMNDLALQVTRNIVLQIKS